MSIQNARERADQELFDGIAQSYASKDLIPSVRAARRLRAIQTLSCVENAGALLEVGCGAGHASVYLKGRYADYTGIDYSEGLIDFARASNSGANCRFIADNIRGFDFGRKFDTILMIGVLHHMQQPSDILASFVETLKPGGRIIVNEPQNANRIVSLLRQMRKRINTEYSDDQEEYAEEQLRALFLGAGFSKVKIRAQGYLSTPFAEVKMPIQFLAEPLSRLCCSIDRRLETGNPPWLHRLSWNLIAEASLPLTQAAAA